MVRPLFVKVRIMSSAWAFKQDQSGASILPNETVHCDIRKRIAFCETWVYGFALCRRAERGLPMARAIPP